LKLEGGGREGRRDGGRRKREHIRETSVCVCVDGSILRVCIDGRRRVRKGEAARTQ
jgi:hypothetical protein